MKRIPLIICTVFAAFTLSACGDKDKGGDGTNHMYDVALCGNPKSLDPQFADDPSSNTVIKNLYSGLVMADENGGISCCNAESYTVSPDGLTYTFKLREDNYWFFDEDGNDVVDEEEYFPVVADDYVFALQRVLDPKMQSPYAGNFSCIKNGSAVLSGSAQPDTLGVIAPDEYTLEISLDYPCTEFLSMLSTAAASPCNKEFFYSTKGRYGLDDKSVMSNGAFYVRQWFYDPYGVHNILYMRRNDINVNEKYQVLPSYVSFSIQENEADVKELFKDGDIECISTLSSSYSSKYNIESTKAMTLGLIFNDNDAYFGNKELRKALALATDRAELESRIGSDLTAASGIIPPAVTVAGRSYRELASDGQFVSYDIDEAKKCFERAKNYLGIGSFEQVKILVNADTVDSRELHILSQSWQDSLGIYIGIEDVTSEEFEKRIASGEYSIALYPLCGNVNSGISVMEQFEKVDCLKKAAGGASFAAKLMHCGTVAETVEAYSSAEKEVISGYGFIPLFYKKMYLVSQSDNDDIIYDAFSGAVDFRIAQNYS